MAAATPAETPTEASVEEIVLESLDLMHALVEDGDDADVAVRQSFPVDEMALETKE